MAFKLADKRSLKLSNMSLPISNNRAASAGSAYYTPKREKKLGESAVAMPDSEISQLLALTATGAAALYLYTAARQLLRLEKREDTLPKAVLIPGLHRYNLGERELWVLQGGLHYLLAHGRFKRCYCYSKTHANTIDCHFPISGDLAFGGNAHARDRAPHD
jgi:hypothetical protein